jgi:hypothetical protein
VNTSTGALSPVAGSPFSIGSSTQGGQPAFNPTGSLVAITHTGPGTGISVFSVTPSIPPPVLSLSEDSGFSGVVANDNCAVPGTSATVDWGDGTPTASVSVGPGGAIIAGHAYAEEGKYQGSVTVADSCGATGAPLTATVSDAPLSASPATVNATAGVALDGQIARFTDGDPGGAASDYSASIDWGDGATSPGKVQAAPGGAFTVIGDHTYPKHGSYPVQVIVADAGGATTTARSTATVAVNPLPPPELGKKVNAYPDGGSVLVKPTKGSGFVELVEPRQLPVGAEIDSRGGTVTLITATTRRNVIQTGQFGGAQFTIDQSRNRLQKGLATLTLIGSNYASCTSHPAVENPFVHIASGALSGTVLQSLRARESHGHFRTRGRYSAATVRGTVWDTVDRCDGTLTVVYRGTVEVTDFHLRKMIAVHAGRSYLAKAA